VAHTEELRGQRLRALGQAIRSRRASLGITQAAVGGLVGIAQADVSRIEIGRHALRIDRPWMICDALEITPAGLLAVADEIVERLRAE